MQSCLQNVKIGDAISYNYVSISGSLIPVIRTIIDIRGDIHDRYYIFYQGSLNSNSLIRGFNIGHIRNLKIIKVTK